MLTADWKIFLPKCMVDAGVREAVSNAVGRSFERGQHICPGIKARRGTRHDGQVRAGHMDDGHEVPGRLIAQVFVQP